jgi:homoserine kinase
MAVAAATNDFEALRISNILIASGAIASGISGSGPSISVVCYPEDEEILRSKISEMGMQTISTSLFTSRSIAEEAS